MKSADHPFHKLRILNTIAFVAFCYFVGGATTISLTCLIFDISADQLSETLKHPDIMDKPVVITQALLFSISGFIIFPTVYLSIVHKDSLSVLRQRPPIRLHLLSLTILLVISTLPVLSLLIELNAKVPFPEWLSDVETYFKETEEAAHNLSTSLLVFRNLKDLLIAIIVIAIIPGFAEEYFFRGLVQTQLQSVLKNHHYAIILSALLFSLMHFQFYGLVPRMALGILFGYTFVWSGNLWHPIIGHIVNNSVGVLLSYFMGPTVLNPESENPFPAVLMLVSLGVAVAVVLYLRKTFRAGRLSDHIVADRH